MPYAVNNGTKIYWEEEGAGPPLLLIMGLGYTLDMWFRVRPHLAQRYRTILFDNRGVGRSDVPPGPYPVHVMASDAIAVLDAAGADRAHVLGISMGGMIAQEVGLSYPARVRSLILGCTACGGPDAVRAEPQVLQALMSRGSMSADEGIEVMVPYIYDASTPRQRIDEDLAIRRRTFPTSEGYFAQVQGVMTFTSHDRLEQIKMPTLVMHGENDLLVPPGNAQLLANKIAGSRLVMLPNAGHVFPTDQPEASLNAVMTFLKGVGDGTN